MQQEDGVRHDKQAGTYAKGDRRRAEIVTRAMELFAANGYERTSMVQVAAASGISRAGLLHHFPAKDELLIAVLEERDRLDDARHFDHLRPDQPLEWLTGLVDLVTFNTTQPELVRLFAALSAESSAPEHPAHDYFTRRYADTRADFTVVVDALAAQGLLRSGITADGLAVELIALVDGLQVQWLIDPEAIDMASALRRRLDGLLAAPLPL